MNEISSVFAISLANCLWCTLWSALMLVCCAVFSLSVVSNSLWPHRLQPTRPLCPWGISRQEYWSEMPLYSLGIFPTQGSNPGLPNCRWILYHLSHQGSLRILEWVACFFSRGLPHSGTKLGSAALQVDSLPVELPRKPCFDAYSITKPFSFYFIFEEIS